MKHKLGHFRVGRSAFFSAQEAKAAQVKRCEASYNNSYLRRTPYAGGRSYDMAARFLQANRPRT